MFYESISHKVVPVADAAEAATKIKEGNASSPEAFCWENANGKFYVVSDSHINNFTFAETAVLQEIDSEFFEIESISTEIIETKEELTQYFVNAVKYPQIKIKTQLIIGKATNQVADFWCVCCERQFEDNVAKQHAHDQDDGYGICDNCEKYYI
jgi:hypothetical protein